MLRRLESGERPAETQAQSLPSVTPEYAVQAVGESEFGDTLLPRDHPQWAKDALTVSQRARELIARLRPAAVRVLTFWDHRLRSALVGGKRICIDASGSYRLE